MIATLRDIVDAVENGRSHDQRFFKNAGTTGDGQWHDWSFASGQPAYDARIGTALAFNPFIAQGNDAIYFPPAPGMDRRLLEVDVARTASGTGQLTTNFQVYDLLGVYPLIDGDSTDEQAMDNTETLPRYATGAGVQAVLVNHVAPVLSAADATVEYTNSQGSTQTVTWQATAAGQNKVNYTTASGGSHGPLYCSLAAGDSGIRSINKVTFATAPGGLWAIYLVKPIGRMFDGSGIPAVTARQTVEKNFAIQNGWNLPKIEDGAWLGLFFMPNGSARSVALHGNMRFIWG